jgi:hypothetical protein
MENKMDLTKRLDELFNKSNLTNDDNISILNSVKQLEEERNALNELIRKTPNDMDLGKQIRTTYRK